MPDIDPEPKFLIGQEVTIYGGVAVYIAKNRKWDGAWPMWIYDCFLKGDKKESMKPFPEQVLLIHLSTQS